MSDPMADASSNYRPGFISSSLRRNSIGTWIVVTVLILLWLSETQSVWPFGSNWLMLTADG